MRIFRLVAIALACFVAVLFGALVYVGNTGEVVTLTTTDASGARQQTSLWIVDRDGVSWLRAGSAEAKWLARIRAQPRIEIERAGKATVYRGTLVPEATGEINQRMAEKYGFADRLVGWLVPRSRETSMAVRLDPDTP